MHGRRVSFGISGASALGFLFTCRIFPGGLALSRGKENGPIGLMSTGPILFLPSDPEGGPREGPKAASPYE